MDQKDKQWSPLFFWPEIRLLNQITSKQTASHHIKPNEIKWKLQKWTQSNKILDFQKQDAIDVPENWRFDGRQSATRLYFWKRENEGTIWRFKVYMKFSIKVLK